MRYLYTDKPDESCHEVKPGVWGRPCHTSEVPKLVAKGWMRSIPDSVDSLRDDAVKAYEENFGKKPHHKMKVETIIEALKDDQGPVGEQDTDSDGREHSPE